MSISLVKLESRLSKLATDSSAKSHFTCAYEISAKELIEYLHNISAAECERRFQRREKRENASTIISTRSFRPVTRANSNDCFSPGGGNKPCCAQQRRRGQEQTVLRNGV